MRKPLDRDPYTVLGISKNVSQADIRAAYIARARVIHPDRFDRTKQEREWNLANEMLKELNQAYEILADQEAKTRYDSQTSDNEAHSYSGARANPSDERETPDPPQYEPERPTPLYKTPLFYLLGLFGTSLGSAVADIRVAANPRNPELVALAYNILTFVLCGLMGYFMSRAIDSLIQKRTGRLFGKILFAVCAIYALSLVEDKIRGPAPF